MKMHNNRLILLKKALLLSCVQVCLIMLQRRYKQPGGNVERKIRKKRSLWVRPIFQRRRQLGFHDNLLREISLTDSALFFNFTRMNSKSFEYLLMLIGPLLKKTSPREALTPSCRLSITLRFLATGDSYPSLSFAFRTAPSTICNVVRETCLIIWEVLSPIYLKPLTQEEWLCVENDFYKTWQFPNCIGALDGKHIKINAPSNSGSLYFNYKKDFSMVLLAACDAKYFFTYVDIGAYGSQSDGGILKNSNFGQRLRNNSLNVPTGKFLPNSAEYMPLFLAADDAFPLQTYIMKPYSKKRSGISMAQNEQIFNYRLSRARRVIENTFGIMVARFRIFHRVINAKPETVDNIVKAVVCLHNFIKSWKDVDDYCNATYIDREQDGRIVPGYWRNEVPKDGGALQPVQNLRFGNRNSALDALLVRDRLKDYVNGIGSNLCPWQGEYIRRTS